MSYINRSTGNARSATILAVAGLHVAAAWAIINGLGIDYIRHEVFNLPSKNYPAPKPQVLPEPPKPKPSEMNDHQIVPLDTPVDLSGPTTFQLPPLDPPDLSGAPSDPLPGPHRRYRSAIRPGERQAARQAGLVGNSERLPDQ